MGRDTIVLSDLRVATIIGIYEWERQVRQTVSISVEMSVDVRAAAQRDSIEHTLNYKAVAKRLAEFAGGSTFQLIETLAERVAEIIVREFGVAHVKVALSKPGAVRGARDVGVRIERTADDYRA